MSKIVSISFLALALVLVGLTVAPAFATTNSDTTWPTPPAFDSAQFAAMQARHADMIAAIENGDFAAWQALQPEGSPLLEKITADNFARFAEAHRLMQESRVILEELGLPGPGLKLGWGMGRGHHFGHGLMFNLPASTE